MMARNIWIRLAFFTLIILIILLIYDIVSANPLKEELNVPSQCYTNMQPSNYFKSSDSPMSENTQEKYIKIDMQTSEFFTGQIKNTGSMRPAVSDYSTIIYIKPQKEEISIGDIISFECNQEKILHRVISINDSYYTTKGDNNDIEDNCKTKFEDIDGKVVGILF